MSSEREISAYNAGAAGGLYTGNSAEELAAYQSGQANRRGGGAAAGGAGIMLLPPLLLAAIPALVIGTCIFPLAGILTLVGTSLIAGLLPDNINFLMMLVVVLLPGIVMFVFALKLEKMLERQGWYRATRHIARLLVVGFVAHVFGFALFSGAGRNTGAFWLDRVTLPHVVMVVAAMVGAHFLFRRLDGKFGDAATFSQRFRLRRPPTPA